MRGILFSQMEPPEGWDTQFHDWYDTDHIPVRLALPGFDGATRYRAVEGDPRFLAVYDIGDMGVLDTPAYQAIKESPTEQTTRMLGNVHGFTRYTCEEISDTGDVGRTGDYLAVVAFAVPPADLAQFDDWYETEHGPMLQKAVDWLRIRRYGVLSGVGGDWNRFALHELASLDVMSSPERAAARLGPKRDALAGREWFGNSGRWQYQVLTRAGKAAEASV